MFLLVFISFLGCKDQKQNPALASLNLLRGDLQLCGNGQFGDVSFSESCSYETRVTFNLAIALLHSFEYTEAEKAFVQVIDQDPECAMAYWGVAMSIYHGLWAPPPNTVLEKGSKLLEVAAKLPKSKKAEQYLGAIGAFYEDWETVDNQTRKERYAKKMGVMYNANSDDTEVAVFYALALRASAVPTDKTYKIQREAGQILEVLFEKEPNHPGIAHYIIHSYDYPELAELGLTTARRYAEIAPNSAHAQHMPSHIFTRLGLWEESINTNISSASSATCYAESIAPGAHWDEEVHAMGYLVYSYLQIGDNENALEQYNYLKSFEEVFPPNFKIAYTAAAIPARIAIENKNWEEAAAIELPKNLGLAWESFPWQKSILHFTRAMGAIHTKDLDAAENELNTLKSFQNELIEMNDAYKANQVGIQIKMAEGWLALAKGNKEEALSLMETAVIMESITSKHPVTPGEVVPADELFADMLLTMNKPQQALDAYELNLQRRPNRFNGIYGAAIAAKQSGNQEKANHYFNQLIELTKDSNSKRPEVAEAKKFIHQS
ncbi:tetratricopeptide repeat protein [Maribacter algarum]|uniref:Tetratricopeptide repeat protein n=2 Tax=Maribacter algarum (ex Zhang et al. 2020) TaxID=2578118 RepID=A0A5S3PPC6_9FLAO|nr:tetratricopeptide repeat protein [Maribacter algarum]